MGLFGGFGHQSSTYGWLVVTGTCSIFPYIGNFIISTDEIIFFRGVGIPPMRIEILASGSNVDPVDATDRSPQLEVDKHDSHYIIDISSTTSSALLEYFINLAIKD